MRRTSGHNGCMRSENRNALCRGGKKSKDNTMSDDGMGMDMGRTGTGSERQRKRKSV